MLTDAALKHLKPKEKAYKVTDRDGMYVRVGTNGTISFRLDYRLNGRRETVTIGKYGPSGVSLARAREKCIDAKRMVQEGLSPSIEKQRDKRRIKEAKSFGQFGEKWLTAAPMADSTRAMRRSIFERELLPAWRNRLLFRSVPTAEVRCSHCHKRGRKRDPQPTIQSICRTEEGSTQQCRRADHQPNQRRQCLARADQCTPDGKCNAKRLSPFDSEP